MVGSPSVTLGDRPAGGEDDDRAAQALTRPRAAVAQDKDARLVYLSIQTCLFQCSVYMAQDCCSPCFLYIYIYI